MSKSSRTTRSTKTAPSNNGLEEVTNDLANLKIKPRSTKPSATTPQLSLAEKLRDAMVIVNDASKTISAAAKSGWKSGVAGSEESEWSETRVNKTMEPVLGALSTLRLVYREQGNESKIVDVERAALGVVSRLNTIQMYKLALGVLAEVRPSILSLLGVPETKEPKTKPTITATSTRRPPSRAGTSKDSTTTSPDDYLSLLSLPRLPESQPSVSEASAQSLSTALATYQAHAIKSVLAVLNHSQLPDLCSLLISPDFLLTRAPPPSTALPVEQLSALYVGAFQSIAGTPALTPPPASAEPTAPPAPRKTSSRAPSATRAHTRTASSSSAKAASASGSKSASKAPASTTLSFDDLALLCRKQALLLLARSPSVERDMDLFWDQATKWGAVYVKGVSALSSRPSEQHIAQTLSAFFSDLIAHVPAERATGARFEALCDWWMRFAKKVKDVETIQKIATLLQPPSTPKRPTPTTQPPAPTKSSSAVDKDSTALDRRTPAPSRSAILAVLDRAAISTSPADMRAAADALNTLVEDAIGNWSTGDSRRLVIAVSDLRKSCMECWKSGKGGEDDESRDAAMGVVDAMVRCAQTPGFPPEITVSAIDALLTLSRAELDPKDYESYGRASSELERALKLAEASSSLGNDNADDLSGSTSHNHSKTQGTLLRAVSNTAYTLAGVLYNATLATHAIPFAQRACTVGERALELGATRDDEMMDTDSRDKDIRALREHMARRWELLAVCQLKATDRRGAVEAFGKALVWSVVLLCPAQSLDEKTGQLVGQLVSISVGELFDPEVVVLSRLFSNIQVEEGLMVAMMERVIRALEGMMHKPITRRAMEIATEELMRAWGDGSPIKKAKLMIGMLKQEYQSASPPTSRASSTEIIELLSSEDLRNDTPLKQHVPEYIAQTRIWAALLLHKSNAPTAEISEQASLASKGLIGLLTPPEIPATSKSAGKRSATVGRRGTVSKRGGKAAAASSVVTPIKQPPIVLDDRTGLVRTMDMLAQVLGLLGHTVLKLQFLHLITWLCEEAGGSEVAEAHVKTSIDLSGMYVQLGQMDMAASILAAANELAEISSVHIDTPTLVLLRLLYADMLARNRETEQSVKTYLAALELSGQIEAVEKNAPYMVRTQARLQALQISAVACGVYASIQASRDDNVSMLAGLTQALRLWNRAVDILLRLSEKTQPAAPAEPANPFEVQDTKSSALDDITQVKKTVARGAIMDGVQWQIAQGLLRTIFDLGEAYSMRGSVREAEFFLAQAQSLSESLQAPLGIGRSLIRQAELKMARGLLDEGLEMLAAAEDIVANPVGVDTATLHCFLGHHRQREASGEDAYAMYAHAQTILDQLDQLMGGLQRHHITPKTTPEVLAPEVRALILRERIWLNHIGEVEPDDKVSVDALESLPRTLKSKAEEAALLGRIALHGVYTQFRSDLFLSSLTESAIAVPMGMTSKDAPTAQAPPTREALNSLGVAEQNFWKTLQLSVARGDATRTREAATNLARILAFQSSLGRQGVEGAVLTATLLDYSNATTLRRELLDAISNKIKPSTNDDDLQWPAINANGLPSSQSVQKSRGLFSPEQESDDEGLQSGGQTMQQYWQFLKNKYSNASFDSAIAQQINILPSHWTVVTINVTDDKTALIVSRQRPHHPPVIFCLPLDRRGREADEEEKFDYDDAIDELTSIIETSDRITHEGVNIEGNKGAISEWWSERTALDQRMRELLDNIEFCWLGVFKSVLATPLSHSSDTLSLLRSRLDKAFKRNGIGGEKASARPKLDKGLLDCFASISPKCRDEELEDLAYFILDLYQLHGTSIALSEIDIDTLAVDLRSALEEHAAKTKPPSTPVEDHHMFLVLDKNVQRIPWESLPVLRGQSVSRIPSTSFLVDRIQLARHRLSLPFEPPKNSKDDDVAVDRVQVDPRRVRYVLNPKGDLKHTEKQFGPWLKRMKKEAGWDGIIGRKPSEEEMARSLEGSDLFIYFGHGGGEQFIRSQKIKHLPQCAAAMLWGCSSGAMRDMGDFDPIGTPYHYMLAGCPTLVATLWDVTDRECDRFAQSVFTSLKLDATRTETQEVEKTSVIQAVASAREVCKLKYLTGSAPVVYGIPFYL